ncbi:hypothetical protein H7E67_03450 [Clostridium gasigenes]|uniref:hypothetical protein n=1 Tax=Clostridium gasigenes TaxID=94869 RepID=UPI0016274ED4|nr:hypothetical protein [Clostridium gasigenes]MBB6622479.1 hypothetical protein [Clostridium gasigenes]
MKLNKKKIILTILIIGVAWIYNIVIFMGSQTEKPLFFRQQSDISEDRAIDIKYLEKIQIEDPIVKVVFPELSTEGIRWQSGKSIGENNIVYKSMIIFLSDMEMSSNVDISKIVEDGDITITKMIYKTQSGKEGEINLGKITISKKFVFGEKYKILEQIGLEGSSDNSGKNIYKVKDDLQIIGFEGENLENINRLFDVYINGEKLEHINLPVKIARNRPIEVYYEQKKGLKEEDFDVEQYNMELKLKCSDPEGTIDYIITDLKIDIGGIYRVTKPSFIKKLNDRLERN